MKKSRRPEVRADDRLIVVGRGQERNRITIEDGAHDTGCNPQRTFAVRLKAVPQVEEKVASRPQYSERFPEALLFIRKIHHAELAHHNVEFSISKRQVKCIGLPLANAFAVQVGLRQRDHRLIEICGRDADIAR